MAGENKKINQLNTVTTPYNSYLVPVYDPASSGSTVKIAVSDLNSGWIADSSTWTALSSGSGFTRASGSLVLTVGTKVKYDQAGVTKYGYITSFAGTGGSVVTVNGGTDYFVTAGSAITNPYYSFAATPYGFPTWFAYTPIWTGTGGTPNYGSGGWLRGRFSMQAKLVNLEMYMGIGTSPTLTNIVAWRFTIPVPAEVTNHLPTGAALFLDAGTRWYTGSTSIGSDGKLAVFDSSQGQDISYLYPMTWAVNDQGRFSINYYSV